MRNLAASATSYLSKCMEDDVISLTVATQSEALTVAFRSGGITVI